MKSTYVCLLCVLIIAFYSSGGTTAQELSPPVWSVGDWWIVEGQIYDLGKIVAGSQPGWRPKQAWRFEVEDRELVDGAPYFVVVIRPDEENPCPYWFRYWYRVSDRYVGQYELHHSDDSGTKARDIGPAVVRKKFVPDEAIPYFTSTFPTLPVTAPLFTIHRHEFSSDGKANSISSDPTVHAKTEFTTIIQEIQDIDEQTVGEKLDPNLLRRGGQISPSGNKLITIRTASGLKEQQYWTGSLPWYVYSERVEDSLTTRRYFLVDVGKD